MTSWKKIRSGFMLGLAFVFSPCCTPLFVPLLIALLAGTPLAAWIGFNQGWVYGGLTLLSVVSFAFGVRWMKGRQLSKATPGKLTEVHVIK